MFFNWTIVVHCSFWQNTWESAVETREIVREFWRYIFPLHSIRLCVWKRQLYTIGYGHGIDAIQFSSHQQCKQSAFWNRSSLFRNLVRESTSRAVQCIVFGFLVSVHIGWSDKFIWERTVSTEIWMKWRIEMDCIQQWMYH